MLADYHVHSEFSFDSTYDIEQVIVDAINLGLDEICFTDHVDYGVSIDHDEPIEKAFVYNGRVFLNVDYPKYFKKIEYLQNKYKEKITIKKGLEFGVQIHTIDSYEYLFETYPMDFVILSNHQVDNTDLALPMYWENKTQIEGNRYYYQSLLDVMKKYKNYSVLGHLDYPLRYDPNGKCPFEHYQDLVQEILKQAIKDNKGIELNMSYIRYNIGDLTPSKQIFKLYKQLGGQIITIGTDSHSPEHLGRNIELGKQELKELGFNEFCTYENMKPIFHKL